MGPTLTARLERELPLGAASGMARVGDRLFVAADDDNRIAVVPLDGGEVELRQIAGVPAGIQPKAHKRDIEALAAVGGELVGLGSGSTERRRWGFAWPLAEGGDLVGEAAALDLGPLYAELAGELPDLNVEGAVRMGDRLLLFQRGNGADGVNAVVTLAWAGSAQATLRPDAIVGVERHDLGTVAGFPLCFTDAAVLGDRIVVTAVAEAAASTYEDGACVGAAVGVLGDDLFSLDPAFKVEGVEVVRASAAQADLMLAVDDDDPTTNAKLLTARLPVGA